MAQVARGASGDYIVAFRVPNNPEDENGLNVTLPALTRDNPLGYRIIEAFAGLAKNEQMNIMPGLTPWNDVSDGAHLDIPPFLPDPFTQFLEVHNLDVGPFYQDQGRQ